MVPMSHGPSGYLRRSSKHPVERSEIADEGVELFIMACLSRLEYGQKVLPGKRCGDRITLVGLCVKMIHEVKRVAQMRAAPVPRSATEMSNCPIHTHRCWCCYHSRQFLPAVGTSVDIKEEQSAGSYSV